VMEIMITYMQVFIKWRQDEAKASHKAKVYDRALLFVNRGAIECTVGFMIDSRTIKRGNL
jgi:hypothetical protein